MGTTVGAHFMVLDLNPNVIVISITKFTYEHFLNETKQL